MGGISGKRAGTTNRCPICTSPAPHLHPAIQAGGEVQPCRDSFHMTVTSENTPERIAEVSAMIAHDDGIQIVEQ